MRLISAVLGFALRKLGLLAAVVLSLFLGLLLVSILVPAIQRAEAQRDRLAEVAQERAALERDLDELRRTAAAEQSKVVSSLEGRIADQVYEVRQGVADKTAEIDGLRDDRDDACSWWQKLIAGDTCKAAELALDKAEQALDTLEASLDQAEQDIAILRDPELSDQEKLERLDEGGEGSLIEREIDTTESDLAQAKAEEASLQEARGSWSGRVVDLWARSWKWLVFTALLLVLAPGILRVVSYFVLMPLVKRAHRPIHLSEGADGGATLLRTSPAQRTLVVRLEEGEVLSARSEHVRPVQGRIRSHLLYDWSAPFVSFAAGLYGLSRVTGDGDTTTATLATPDDPDSYLMRIDFRDHPGVVMRPRHVVGVIGTPELETRWRWGIQSLATWQVRYIMFAGTGSLIVQGSGDVVATSPEGRSTRMDQHLVMGFDSRLVVGVNRTEVFWPYLWGRTPLVDDEFTGSYPLLWQKSSGAGPSSPVAKVFDAFYSAFGKVLGF